MPDGSIAICYAESVAERLATHAYAEGSAHHYWRPDILESPLRLTVPSGIFSALITTVLGAYVVWQQRIALVLYPNCNKRLQGRSLYYVYNRSKRCGSAQTAVSSRHSIRSAHGFHYRSPSERHVHRRLDCYRPWRRHRV